MATKTDSTQGDPALTLWNPHYHKELHSLRPHPLTGRLTDFHPGVRNREMRLLCLGASRTGTMFIYTALHKLGFRVYHMNEAVKTPRTAFGCWIEAIRAKYDGEGAKFGRREFDRLLGEYDAGADVPVATFGVDLMEAYPLANRLALTSIPPSIRLRPQEQRGRRVKYDASGRTRAAFAEGLLRKQQNVDKEARARESDTTRTEMCADCSMLCSYWITLVDVPACFDGRPSTKAGRSLRECEGSTKGENATGVHLT